MPRIPGWLLSYLSVLRWTKNPKLPVNMYYTSCPVWCLLTHRHILAKLRREIHQSDLPGAITLSWALQLWAGYQHPGLAFCITRRSMKLIIGPLFARGGTMGGHCIWAANQQFSASECCFQNSRHRSNTIFCPSLLVSEMPPAGSTQTLHHIKDCPLWIFVSDLSSLCVQLVPATYHVIPHSKNIYERLFAVAQSVCLTV